MNAWIGISRLLETCAVTISLLAIPAAGAPAELQRQEPAAALLSQLQEKDPEVRKVAIRRLAQMRDRRAVEPLMEILAHDADKEVRRGAAYALGLLKDPRAVEPLIASLKEEDPDLCINAVFALAGMKAEGKEDVQAQESRLKPVSAARRSDGPPGPSYRTGQEPRRHSLPDDLTIHLVGYQLPVPMSLRIGETVNP